MVEEEPVTHADESALSRYARTMRGQRDAEWAPRIAAIRARLVDGSGGGTPVFGVSPRYESGHAAGIAHQERTDKMLEYLTALEEGLDLLVELPQRIARDYRDADEANAIDQVTLDAYLVELRERLGA